jgi:hypothetical protein
MSELTRPSVKLPMAVALLAIAAALAPLPATAQTLY